MIDSKEDPLTFEGLRGIKYMGTGPELPIFTRKIE